VRLVVAIRVVEEFLSRQLLNGRQDLGDASSADADDAVSSAFASEVQLNGRARDGHVFCAQCRQSERVIRPRVLRIADANARLCDEADGCG
jgi:hypothetical protein